MVVTPNIPRDDQVRVISCTVGVAGIAVAQLLGRDAEVVRFPGSLLDSESFQET